MAGPFNPQQRPLCTAGEDTLSAENSMERLEAASPSLRPTDDCKKGERWEGQKISTGAPQNSEDALHAKTVAAEGGGDEKEDAATCRSKGTSGFDEPDLPIPARQRAILNRVLNHWKRTTRKEESTPSKNWCTSHRSDLQLRRAPVISDGS